MDGTVPTMETNRACVRLGGSRVCVGGCRNGLLQRGGVYLFLVLSVLHGVSGPGSLCPSRCIWSWFCALGGVYLGVGMGVDG